MIESPKKSSAQLHDLPQNQHNINDLIKSRITYMDRFWSALVHNTMSKNNFFSSIRANLEAFRSYEKYYN